MDPASTAIVNAVISSSSKHRGGEHVQASEFAGGGVRLTGLQQLSGVALCRVAKELDKLITVTSSRDAGLAVDIEDVPGEHSPKTVLSVSSASLTTAGPATLTSVHPLPERSTSVALAAFIKDRSAVEVLLRPASLTVIAVLPSKVKGGLAECIRNGRHARKSNGTSATPASRRTRQATKVKYRC